MDSSHQTCLFAASHGWCIQGLGGVHHPIYDGVASNVSDVNTFLLRRKVLFCEALHPMDQEPFCNYLLVCWQVLLKPVNTLPSVLSSSSHSHKWGLHSSRGSSRSSSFSGRWAPHSSSSSSSRKCALHSSSSSSHNQASHSSSSSSHH